MIVGHGPVVGDRRPFVEGANRLSES